MKSAPRAICVDVRTAQLSTLAIKARFTRQFFGHGTCLNLVPVPKIVGPAPSIFGKIRGTSAPKHTRAETTYPHGLGTRLFWGTRATNFSIYTRQK